MIERQSQNGAGVLGKEIKFLTNIIDMTRDRDKDRVRFRVRFSVSVRCRVLVVYLT